MTFDALHNLAGRVRERAGNVLVAQEETITLLLVGLIVHGHVLLEGAPGTAKTLTARVLCRLVDAQFTRIQFTPDLMSSDIVGTNVFNLQTSQFTLHKGPIFTQILLADEINRAPAKTQAALLEAMQERQVTIEGDTQPLPQPFMVIATQNPVEMDGTYPLPEAQLDRFLFKLKVDYLPLDNEIEVLRRHHQGFNAVDLDNAELSPLIKPEQLPGIRRLVDSVRVEDGVLRYIAQIISATRASADLSLGASTRAGVALLMASKAYAAVNGRDFVSPDDIKYLVPPVLRHRVYLRPEAEIEGLDTDAVFTRLLSQIEVPR